MKKSKLFIAAVFGLAASTANASTIFSVTDGDINFFLPDLGSYMLAMFDDDDVGFTGSVGAGTALEVPAPSTVGMVGPVSGSGDHLATNIFGDTLSFSGSDNFRLAISLDDVTWFSGTATTFLGANAYLVEFLGGSESVYAIDVLVVQPAAVPVPAAVWLFGSGLIGIVAVARRRT